MTINIDEFMEEHNADKAAAEAEAQRIREAKEEADRLAYVEQERVARLKVAQGRYAIRLAIVEAALRQGSEAYTVEDTNDIFIDGINCSTQLTFVDERTSVSSWRSRPNGKLRLTVGTFGERKSYPQRKDGSFNYADIASTLRGCASRKAAADKAQLMRRNNAHIATDIAGEFNLTQYSSLVVPSSAAPGNVTINFKEINSHTMTPDKARKVLQALRDLGIKLSYNDK